MTNLLVSMLDKVGLPAEQFGDSTGRLTALTDVIHLSSVVKAINDKFAGDVAERNISAAQAAHDNAHAA